MKSSIVAKLLILSLLLLPIVTVAQWDVLKRKDTLNFVENTKTIIASHFWCDSRFLRDIHIQYSCDPEQISRLIITHDTLFIDTCYSVSPDVGADSLYVTYECDPVLNSGLRLNGDTIFIDTCYISASDTNLWRLVYGHLETKGIDTVWVDIVNTDSIYNEGDDPVVVDDSTAITGGTYFTNGIYVERDEIPYLEPSDPKYGLATLRKLDASTKRQLAMTTYEDAADSLTQYIDTYWNYVDATPDTTSNKYPGIVDIKGNINLQTTTSSVGQITQNGYRLFSTYGTDVTPPYTFNTIFGLNSGNFSFTGGDNTAFGTNIFLVLSTGHHNSAFGVTALGSVTTGDNNTAIGALALQNNTTGDENTAVGFYSLLNNVAGLGSTAIGYRAMMYVNSTATPTTTYNTAVGYEAMRGSSVSANNTGKYNTAVGYQSLDAMTSGEKNTAIGFDALGATSTGNNNIGIGYQAGLSNTTGSNQIFIGNSTIEHTYIPLDSASATYGVYYDAVANELVYNIAGIGGVTSHSGLDNLDNDDHTQYALLNGRENDIFHIDSILNYFSDHVGFNKIRVEDSTFHNGITYFNSNAIIHFEDSLVIEDAYQAGANSAITNYDNGIHIAGYHGVHFKPTQNYNVEDELSFIMTQYNPGLFPATDVNINLGGIENRFRTIYTTNITDDSTNIKFKVPVTTDDSILTINGEIIGKKKLTIPTVITDHGGLANLLNDDHPQYALLDGRVGDCLVLDSAKGIAGGAFAFQCGVSLKSSLTMRSATGSLYSGNAAISIVGALIDAYGDDMGSTLNFRNPPNPDYDFWTMRMDTMSLFPYEKPSLPYNKVFLGKPLSPWTGIYTTNITDDSTNIKFNVPVTTDDSVLTINGRVIGKKKLVIPDVSGYQLNADTSTTDATRKWVTDQGYLVAEVDGSVSNELQSLTYNRDTRILEISGGTEDTLNTVAVTNGATGLSNADQIYDFTIGLGYVPTNSTTTQLNYLSSATGTTGTNTTNIVYSTSPTLTTPNIGVATATSITYTDPTPYMNSFRTAPFWVNDFMTSSTQTYPWASTGVSSGTQGAIVGSVNHPGIVKVNSSSTANSGYYYEFINSSLAGLHGNEVTTAIIFPIRTDSVTTRFGFHDATSSSDAVDGVYFEVVPGDGECSGKTANNSVRSTTGTHYHLSNSTWYRLYLVVNGDATRVDYYIFDAAGTQLWTDNLTTNIPTARSTGHGIICTKTLGGVSELINIDYIDCYLGRLTR
jgi:hypothetical protein